MPLPQPETAPQLEPVPSADTPGSAPSTDLSSMQRAMGIASLALMSVAAFFFVFAYLDSFAAPEAQVAAAAQLTEAFEDVAIDADAAIVVELNTGAVLFEKNADAQLPLASITKVPLALAIAEVLPLDESFTMPYDTGFTLGGQRLLKGEVWRVRDVLHFTLVASSNEGAQVLAELADSKLRALYPVPDGEPAALWRMNDLSRSLGLSSTYFRNVNGLDRSATEAGAYGSARDIAKLVAYAASARPELFAGTAQGDLLLVDAAGATTAAFNTNEALGSIPGLIMGKTGYTDLAGGNLAIVFDAGLSQPIAVVVLGSSLDGRFTDTRVLVERARAAIAGQ